MGETLRGSGMISRMTRPRLLALLVIVYVAGIHLQSRLSSQTPPPKRPPEEETTEMLAPESPGPIMPEAHA